ncbi:MAG TPA: hypothetical protein VMU15_02930 [Anaeromyxobacter sp.]|nr:hypothetical protein [Anaeromyxobacter sp.]
MLSSLTVRAWPRRVDPAGPIPHPFHRSFMALELGGAEAPSILYGPRLRFGRYESTAKLLVWSGRRAACLDARRGGVVTTLMNLDEVSVVEWGQALLEAWLRIAAHGPTGHAVLRAEFNTVGRDLYLPLLLAARAALYAGAPAAADRRERLDPLLSVDYRFVGFGRQALLPGAELRRSLFQPRVTEPFLRLFDQTRVRATLFLATQAELIVVQEGEGRGPGRYGVTWTYLPLARIAQVVLSPDPARRVLLMRAMLPGEAEVRWELDTASEDAARAFLQATDPRFGARAAPPEPPEPPPGPPREPMHTTA